MSRFQQIFYLALGLAACGPRVNTGRNDDPASWPTDGQNPSRGSDSSSNQACFDSGLTSMPAEIRSLCSNEIKGIAELSNLFLILCEQGKMLTALNQPTCGWDGAPQTMNNFLHRFYTEKDTTKDYEDITASIVHAPASADRYKLPVRLAYENFDEFKRQGFQWTAGTRENKNMSGTTWDQGIQYRFRADKDVYEVGYQGYSKIYQLSPTLSCQLNHATGDFERISKFAQIVLYSEQPDHSTITLRLENRAVKSQGLFERAKKTAIELDYESMEKGFKNATKP